MARRIPAHWGAKSSAAAVFAAFALLPCLAGGAESKLPPDQQLFEAVRRNDLEAVRAALAAGARPQVADEWGLTAADVALDKGYFPIARFLMDQKGAEVAAPVPAAAPPAPPIAEVPRPAPPPPKVAAPAPPPPAPPPAPAPAPVGEQPPQPEAVAAAPPPPGPAAKDGTFLDRLQTDLRRLLTMDTSAKGPPPEDIKIDREPDLLSAPPPPPPEPPAAAAPPPEPDWAPKEVKVAPALPPTEEKPAPREPEVAVPPVPAPAPAPTEEKPVAEVTEEGAPPVGAAPIPAAQPEKDFFARLSGELKRVLGTEGTAKPPAPQAEVSMVLPPAPEPATVPEPPPPVPSQEQAWMPKEVTLPPAAPAVALPDSKPDELSLPAQPAEISPPAASAEASPPANPTEGDFLSRLSGELRRIMGTEKPLSPPPGPPEPQIAMLPPEQPPALPSPPPPAIAEPAPEPRDWAPKVAVTPSAEPRDEAAEPKPAAKEEPGLLGRFFASLKESMGTKPKRPSTEPLPDLPAPPAESEKVQQDLPPAAAPADPMVAALPEAAPAPAAAKSETTKDGKVPPSLLRLGIPDIGKYLSDEPYRPGEIAGRDGGAEGRLPPLAQVARDPFSPGSPVPGGTPGDTPGRFDPRYERGESQGGLADALAPLDGPSASAPPPPDEGKGKGIFDRLTDFLKPPERLPDRKTPPPPGLFEDVPAAKPPAAPEKPTQTAMTPPKEASVRNLPKASGVALTTPLQLAEGLTAGKALSVQEPVASAAYGHSCVSKERGTVVFCVEPANWPAEIRDAFVVDTVLYQGFQAIVRYDAEKASTIQTLFRADSFDAVVAYFTKLYGPPTDAWMRRIAPLGSPGMDSPSVAWRSGNVMTGQVAHLELRAFDDTRGGFPDLRHGVILLRDAEARPIFPRLSSLDLMVMKPRAVPLPKNGAATPQQQGE